MDVRTGIKFERQYHRGVGSVHLGDFVKLKAFCQIFWVEVMDMDARGLRIIGRVADELGCMCLSKNELVRFQWCHIMEIRDK